MEARAAKKRKEVSSENEELRAQLCTAQERLSALLNFEADAVVVTTKEKVHIFTLKGAETPYRILIEDLSVGASTLAADGTILYSNRRFAEMLESPLQQVIGSPMGNWIVPADRSVFQRMLEAETPGSRRGEIRLRALGGNEVPVYLSVSGFQPGENAAAFCAVATDLTDQKRSEALVAAEMLSNAILEQAGEAIVVCDENGGVIRANSKARALRGGGLAGKSLAEALPLQLADGTFFSLAVMQQGKHFQGAEVSLQSPEGVAYLLLSAGPVVGPLKQVLGYLVTLTDITALKQMEEQTLAAQAELQSLLQESNRSRRALLSVVEDQQAAEKALLESQEQLRLLLDSTAEGIYGLDLEGRCTFCNASSLRLLGLERREEVIGKSMHALTHGQLDNTSDSERACQIYNAVRRGEESHCDCELFRRADGTTFPAEYWAYPVKRDGTVIGGVVAFLDISARKSAEEQLRHASKMEAVGRLAGGVAHDFNNLLTIINGYAQLILEQSPSEHPHHSHLEQILKAGERAVVLTRQLLAFSRKQVLAPQVLDLNREVSSIKKMLTRLIGEDIELLTECAPDLWRVKADPGQIEQVIMNLAINARDAMPQGGKLTIQTANVDLEENLSAEDLVGPPGPYVLLAVGDTGVGMDAETQTRVFEPFFTTKEKGRGTGLGLATVYGIVKQSGGSILVHSETGKGSTFKIYLPRLNEEVTEAKQPEGKMRAASGSETILVVEDNDAVRSLARGILEARGYKLLEAADTGEALKLGGSYAQPIHLLLTDVVMPRMNGRELSARLAPLHPESKVLYMSGYTDDAVVHRGILSREANFLQKPFSPETLARRVREVLDQQK